MSETQRRKGRVFIHPSSFADEGAVIGEGTKIWHFCHVMAGASIGGNCNIGQNVFVGSGAVIGNRVKIQNNVSVYEGVVLEDDVFIGPSAVFTNIRIPRSHVSRKGSYLGTVVRRGATIGANSTIVCGVEVGEFALVGAGAVVTRNVPPHTLVTGVPARRSGLVCGCGGVLPDSQKGGKCPECGKKWKLQTVV